MELPTYSKKKMELPLQFLTYFNLFFRGGPSFGGPGLGPPFQSPGARYFNSPPYTYSSEINALFLPLTLIMVFSAYLCFHASGRPAQNFGDPMGDRVPPNAWHPMSPPNLRPPSNADIHGFGVQSLPRSGDMALPLNLVRTKLKILLYVTPIVVVVVFFFFPPGINPFFNGLVQNV